MPMDKFGKHHLSGQQARHADGMKGMKGMKETPKMAAGNESAGMEAKMSGEHSTIHHHEDGTHSVEHSDGEKSGPHGHLHEAMAHVAAKHGGGGKHHFAHHDGMGGVMAHHVGEDGEVQGEEHGSPEEAAESMGHFMNDGDGDEHGEPDGDEGAMPMEHGHGGGLSGY